MASPIEAPGYDGVGYPSIARVNDYWLEGHNHNATDQQYAEHIQLCAPHIPYLVRASRQVTGRMVRYLLDKGIRQFIDLGSGIPTQGHVHDVAQEQDPGSRVVYVDIDPTIVADGRDLLADNDRVAYLDADIHDRDAILGDPQLTRLIDLSEPVAVLSIETLLYVPDEDDPAGLVGSYLDRLVPGSYLGMTHCAENAELRSGLNIFTRMFGSPPAVVLRPREQFETFFAGLELVDPGVVPVMLWNPLTEDDVGRNAELAHLFAGLGRKR
ncbi:MAG TPA: SAM-dependent methyltransferase [Amycolatopsis sp.]|nr:SAM-dependent methyltransferase [Amycolatopsis sp.]